jgi:hypothetical protein
MIFALAGVGLHAVHSRRSRDGAARRAAAGRLQKRHGHAGRTAGPSMIGSARFAIRSRATRRRSGGEWLLAPDGVVAQNPRMRVCRRATGAGAR